MTTALLIIAAWILLSLAGATLYGIGIGVGRQQGIAAALTALAEHQDDDPPDHVAAQRESAPWQ